MQFRDGILSDDEGYVFVQFCPLSSVSYSMALARFIPISKTVQELVCLSLRAEELGSIPVSSIDTKFSFILDTVGRAVVNASLTIVALIVGLNTALVTLGVIVIAVGRASHILVLLLFHFCSCFFQFYSCSTPAIVSVSFSSVPFTSILLCSVFHCSSVPTFIALLSTESDRIAFVLLYELVYCIAFYCNLTRCIGSYLMNSKIPRKLAAVQSMRRP